MDHKEKPATRSKTYEADIIQNLLLTQWFSNLDVHTTITWEASQQNQFIGLGQPQPLALSIVLKFFSDAYVHLGMRTIAPDQCCPTGVSGMMAMFYIYAVQ